MIYEPLQAVELFSLVFSFAALIIMAGFCRGHKDHCLGFMFWAYAFVVAGLLCTSLESLFLPKMFNFLEHLFRIALPALLFAAASFNISKMGKNGKH